MHNHTRFDGRVSLPVDSFVQIASETPLRRLAEIFPQGIPIAAPFPSLDLNGVECYEVLWQGRRLDDLLPAIFDPAVPDLLGRAWLDYQVLALPVEWVEPLHRLEVA